jgi:hypothetical protein
LRTGKSDKKESGELHHLGFGESEKEAKNHNKQVSKQPKDSTRLFLSMFGSVNN